MFDSLYIGKVIHDSDLLCKDDTVPQNRVKVFIHGLTPSIEEDFDQPRGKTNENTMSTQALNATGQEFYAHVMMPIMGGGTGAKYNANTDILSVSDTGNITDLNACPPADAYSHTHDGYLGGNSIGTAGVNVTANAYSPDNRSNAYKGMMALPSVGATVVVSFINNERSMPIILGVIPSVADVESVHGVGFNEEVYPNYSMAYSNLNSESMNTNPTTPGNGSTFKESTSADDPFGAGGEAGFTAEGIGTTTTAPDGTVTTTNPDGTVTITKPDNTVTTTTKDGTVTTRKTLPDGTVTTSKSTGSTTNTTTTKYGERTITKAHEFPDAYVKRGNATVRVPGGLSQAEREDFANQMLKGQARAEKNTQKLLARNYAKRTDKEKAEKAKEVRERGLKNRGITYNE
tara:strand:+ start:5076 stop:6281 length:1206 start_codon:yes stop_codon:yes gene_type:complete